MGSVKLNRFLTVYNGKDRKQLKKALREQFGVKYLPDVEYLETNQDKVYVLSKDVRSVSWESLRIDRAGVYIGKWLADGFRPSMEGAALIGDQVQRNVVELNKQGLMNWLKGRDVQVEDGSNKFVLVRYRGDFLGGAKMKDNVVMNGLSKARKTTTLIP